MAFMSSMNVVGSALTAEMLRLDVISENITNINTTRTEGGGPYRRKVVVLEEQGERTPFQLALARAGSAAAPARPEGCVWWRSPRIPRILSWCMTRPTRMQMRRGMWRCPTWI